MLIRKVALHASPLSCSQLIVWALFGQHVCSSNGVSCCTTVLFLVDNMGTDM